MTAWINSVSAWRCPLSAFFLSLITGGSHKAINQGNTEHVATQWFDNLPGTVGLTLLYGVVRYGKRANFQICITGDNGNEYCSVRIARLACRSLGLLFDPLVWIPCGLTFAVEIITVFVIDGCHVGRLGWWWVGTFPFNVLSLFSGAEVRILGYGFQQQSTQALELDLGRIEDGCLVQWIPFFCYTIWIAGYICIINLGKCWYPDALWDKNKPVEGMCCFG